MSLAGVAAALKDVPRHIINDAIDGMHTAAQASAARVVGSGAVMRMHTSRGRRPTKMSTKSSKISRTSAGVTTTVKAIPGGPWHWLEDGTKPHEIGRGRHLSFGGANRWIIGPVHHPGARGQQAWTKAVNEFRQEFVTISVKDLRKGLNGK